MLATLIPFRACRVKGTTRRTYPFAFAGLRRIQHHWSFGVLCVRRSLDANLSFDYGGWWYRHHFSGNYNIYTQETYSILEHQHERYWRRRAIEAKRCSFGSSRYRFDDPSHLNHVLRIRCSNSWQPETRQWSLEVLCLVIFCNHPQDPQFLFKWHLWVKRATTRRYRSRFRTLT